MSEILYTLEEAKQKWPEYTGIIGNRFNNISGQHINSLKILYRGPNLNDAKKRPQYVCQCDCGSYCLIKSENITSKAKPTKTCGHCKNFQLKKLKKNGDFDIIKFFKNENDNNRECAVLQCTKCNYIFYPRVSTLYDNEYKCNKCNSKATTKNYHIGDIIGELTLIDRKVDKNNKIKWYCKCSCGEELILNTVQLHNRTSCGNHYNPSDIINKKFGKYIVIKDLQYYKGGQRYYLCKCDCGNLFSTGRGNILTGHTTSCGCAKKLQLKNQKFGLLTVIEEIEDKREGTYWLCQCDCGNKKIVNGVKLKQRQVKSCGCIGLSFNNKNISNYLKENNILFVSEYRFLDCRNIFPLPFDFAIKNNNNNIQYIIEYDGEQHFYPVDHFGGEEKFIIRHKNDLIKNKYCFDNNIPIIRIPYDAEYTIDDLKLETTRFLLTPENEEEYYNRK